MKWVGMSLLSLTCTTNLPLFSFPIHSHPSSQLLFSSSAVLRPFRCRAATPPPPRTDPPPGNDSGHLKAGYYYLGIMILAHIFPNLKKEYRSSLLFFSGCLYSFGILLGMAGINQTMVPDLEDKIVSI
ncbi:hypothetical protein Lal_00017776 [Lupinus albus]|nr:hypothetical protein Lal_00017776 [Lupinus albus]